MNTKSTHILAEFWCCDRTILDDLDSVERLLSDAVTASGATLVQLVMHRFAPQGVSGVAVLEESHLSMHTWPEAGYAAVDVITCGDCCPKSAIEVLREGLCAERTEIMTVERGMEGARSMKVRRHGLLEAKELASARLTS